MKECLLYFDDYSIPFLQPNTPEDIEKFAEKVRYPFIIKPKNGVGSQGVYKISRPSDLNAINFCSNLIVEQYISGDEYSVESFSFNGKHKVIAITEKTLLGDESLINFTEIGHSVPANVSDKQKIHIENYISNFLDIIGLDNGPSHTEIKIKDYVIRIIETHNRIGGDRISSLVKLSTKVDLVELSILWPLNMCEPIEDSIVHEQAASINFSPQKLEN